MKPCKCPSRKNWSKTSSRWNRRSSRKNKSSSLCSEVLGQWGKSTMGKQSRLVFDVLEQSFEANAQLAGQNWSMRHRRLQGGLSDGVDLIELDNGALKLTLVPTRGMGIWK